MGRRLIKKVAAVMVSMVMVLGAVSIMPVSVIKDSTIVASAKNRSNFDEVEVNECIFYFSFTERTGSTTIAIEDVEILNDTGTVNIPSTITFKNKDYAVTDIAKDFLERNTIVRDVTIPDSVTKIAQFCLLSSTVERVTLSNNVEYIGTGFCGSCPELKYENVIYNGTKLIELTSNVFSSSPGMVNEKGAVCLGSWLIKYTPDSTVTSIRIAELGNGDVGIDHLGDSSITNVTNLYVLDLEGVEYIGNNNFRTCSNLTNIINDDSILSIGNNSFTGSSWLNSAKNTGLARLGDFLFYYQTDGNIIDLTSDKLAGIKNIKTGAFIDCKNADTLICNSDTHLNNDIFYKAYYNTDATLDLLPVISSYNIKTIYLDGKKLEFSKDEPLMSEWVREHCDILRGTEWKKIQVENKTRALFEQLDMPYYGLKNDMIGELTPTQEFYSMLKIHEYLSTYDYDYDYHCTMDSYLTDGIANCLGYATLANYLLICSGVRSIHISSESTGKHAWNQVMIGGEWFESDMGWDEQTGHDYEWFGLSTANVLAIDEGNDSSAHKHVIPIYTWYYNRRNRMSDYKEAQRTIGDLNNDGCRDEKDAVLLWDYIKGNISIDRIDAKAADINFDGVIDITDGVLLENFVFGTSVDPEDYPTDSMSPGFKVAFVTGYDLKDLDPNEFVYEMTDRDGYIVLPEVMFKAPKGKKFAGWNLGKAGKKVKISDPYTVIQPIWADKAEPESNWLLGDVDGNNVIDIGDVSLLCNHINGVKALDEEALLRADVNKSDSVDISDASTIINHINGVKAIEGKV